MVREVIVLETERGLYIDIKADLLFDFDKYEIKPEGYKVLDETIDILKSYPKNKVSIEGHTDSIGSTK